MLDEQPMESTSEIRVIVGDDHNVVLGGLKSIFAGTEISVVAEGRTGDELLAMVKSHDADLIILDVRMTGNEGLALLRDLKRDLPERSVLVFSAFDNPTFMAQAADLGANGYLLKTSDRNTILAAVRSAAQGKSLWSRVDMRRINSASTMEDFPDLEVALTHREFDVLREVALGRTNKQIAESIGIGYETVKEHVQHVLKKIGVVDRTQAALWAVQKGIL